MLTAEDLLGEIVFTTSRSSGPGGQHVNKVDSKVTLKFDVQNSSLLSEAQKKRLMDKLSLRLTKAGVLIMTSQSARSQLANKKKVLERFNSLLEKALKREKSRKKTRPSEAAVKKRLDEKKQIKEKKERRRNPL